jgi:opacity protein-like surface antigen
VDAFLTKLAETGVAEEDGDTDFYGIYGTWLAPEVVNVSAYYYLLRDGRSLADTNHVWTLEWVEDALGLDDYDPTTLHTAGLRAYGQYSAFDYDLEAAYQWGEASQVGFGFKPFTYGDDDAEYDSWAADADLGYTFDVPWQPRVFVGGAYFGGEDNRDLSFIDWLNPFYTPEASVSFNRLFSGIAYSSILDIGQDLSNAWQARGGVQVKVRDNLSAGLTVAYWEALEPFDRPLALHLGRWYVPVAPEYSFLTRENDTDLGLTTHLHATYNYTDDLFIRVGWEHLFTGDGLEQGNFLHRFGQEFTGGRGGDDADYFYFDLGVKFPGGVAAMKPCGAL